MKVADIVKFKVPMSEFEKNSIYEIVNINEGTNRALIQITNSNLPIAPTELVSLKDIEKI